MACLSEVQRQFLALVNQARSTEGLMPLRVSTILQDAAAAKAGQLAALPSSVWSGDPHTLNGVTARELVLHHGYPEQTWTGENLLYGVDTAAEAFDMWWHSPPHRANMMTREYTEIGIAGPVGGSWQHPGDVYDVWVTEFGSARTETARACGAVGEPPPPPPERPPDKPTRPTVPRTPPPRQDRRRRRRWRKLLRRLRGRP